jgi:hypothetical protein
MKILGVVAILLYSVAAALAQADSIGELGAAMIAPAPNPYPISQPINAQRMFGLLPDYQTVRDPHLQVLPLTVKEKWGLLAKQTVDPFNIVSAAMGAGMSQIGDQTPKYGYGKRALGDRMGAAVADMTTQSVFSVGVLACALHQDPRYYRKGPEYSILRRTAYSISRLVVTRKDSGPDTFNSSGIFGMALGIGASNLYYPAASANTRVMLGRLNTSLSSGVIGNLMSEFWPDLEAKFFHRRRR